LFKIAIAYNAGIGNLRKWEKSVRFDEDPLLFIESIPMRETRIYVERVLANFWIYRERLSQPTPALDAVVAGEWPIYVPFDRTESSIAEDVANRREPALHPGEHRGPDRLGHSRRSRRHLRPHADRAADRSGPAPRRAGHRAGRGGGHRGAAAPLDR